MNELMTINLPSSDYEFLNNKNFNMNSVRRVIKDMLGCKYSSIGNCELNVRKKQVTVFLSEW